MTSLPELKSVITKSSSERAKLSNAAARMPGIISGNVTFAKVRNGPAPRSIAASSSDQSKPRRRALTVSATKLTQNMMCAIKIVVKLRVISRVMNRLASDEPEHDLGCGEREHEQEIDGCAAAESVARQRERR